MAHKYKLNEMSKVASEKEAEKVLDKPEGGFEVGQVTVSDDGQRKSTIYKIDNETGQVSWKIEQLPGYDLLYDELDELVSVAKRVYVKSKDDDKFRDFYEEARKLRNKVRTHLRNEYPDEYKRIVRLSEDEVDEVSMSGAAGAYNTPYAFVRKPLRPKNKKKKKKSKYKMKLPSGMVSSLGYTMGEVKEELQLVHVYDKDGKMFGTGSVEKIEGDKTFVRFDGSTVKRFPSDRVKPVKEGKLGDGADLGPGPKAGPDGVVDSSYTKQFKYKLVPKTKDGTYVQKGSGMIVKKLF